MNDSIKDKSHMARAGHPHIHVIDPDYRRRARITRELSSRAFHAEAYEDLDEFAQRPPSDGVVFTADDVTSPCGPEDVARALQTYGSALPVVVYAARPVLERVVNAMLSGALDYLEWPFDPRSLDTAFERLSTEGERKADQERRKAVAKFDVQRLSNRERDVLALMARGYSNKDMGETLNISPRTVEIHRANLMKKLSAGSTSDAIRVAIYAGLDEETELQS